MTVDDESVFDADEPVVVAELPPVVEEAPLEPAEVDAAEVECPDPEVPLDPWVEVAWVAVLRSGTLDSCAAAKGAEARERSSSPATAALALDRRTIV